MKTFIIKGKVWKYPGPSGWHFVYVGAKESAKLKVAKNTKKVAWGYIKILATVGRVKWETTLFPSKEGPYLLALKSDIRKKADVQEGDMVTIKCTLV